MTYWVATRQAIHPATDEDAAMAWQLIGRFANRDDARESLLRAVAHEIEAFTNMAMGEAVCRHAEVLAALILNPSHNQAEDSGVIRWSIRQVP